MTVTNDNGYDYVDKLNIEGELYNVADTAAREAIDDINSDISDISSSIESLEETQVDFNGTNTYGPNAVNIFPDPSNVKIGPVGLNPQVNLRQYIVSLCGLRITEANIAVGAIDGGDNIPYTNNVHYVESPDGVNGLASKYRLLGIVGWTQWSYAVRITSHRVGNYIDLSTHSSRAGLQFGIVNTSNNRLSGGNVKFYLLWGMMASTIPEAEGVPSTGHVVPANPSIDCPNCDGTDTTCPYWLTSENRHMTTTEIQIFEWLEWHYQDETTGLWYELRTGNTDPVIPPDYIPSNIVSNQPH